MQVLGYILNNHAAQLLSPKTELQLEPTENAAEHFQAAFIHAAEHFREALQHAAELSLQFDEFYVDLRFSLKDSYVFDHFAS